MPRDDWQKARNKDVARRGRKRRGRKRGSKGSLKKKSPVANGKAESPLKFMPFGAHKGTRLEDLPESYLRWLLTLEITNNLRSGAANALHRILSPKESGRKGPRKKVNRRKGRLDRKNWTPEDACLFCGAAGIHEIRFSYETKLGKSYRVDCRSCGKYQKFIGESEASEYEHLIEPE